MTAQQANLSRVVTKIADAILSFCAAHTTFHASDLLTHVRALFPEVSPDSPSRVLRMLRRGGRVQYRVLSRSQSLYQIVPAFDGNQARLRLV